MSREVKLVETKSPPCPKGPPSTRAMNPPALTHYRTVGDNKRVDLSSIIFKSGEKLLREKIENMASGLPAEKYSVSQHMHKLNEMFPETKEYEREYLKKAISEYTTYARKKVAALEETGQGKMNAETYSMKCSDELKYVCLLSDARKSYKEVRANSRYQGISGTVDRSSLEDLEEEETCFICGNTQGLISTEIGMICRECMTDQEARGKKNLNVQFRIEDLQQQKREKVLENKRLADTEKTGINVPSGTKKNKDPPKRRFDDAIVDSPPNRRFHDDKDDKISKMLVSRLKMSKKREELELEKARLDVLIKRKKLASFGDSFGV